MEQNITIGDGQVSTFDFDYKKEVEVDSALWISVYLDESIILSDSESLYWKLSKEEMCTFIKLLVSHLELPLEFK